MEAGPRKASGKDAHFMKYNSEPILESSLSQGDVTVDRDNGIIKNVKLCGAKSRNKRTYTDSALKDLAKLYEDTPIRLGHDETSYLKTVGSVGETRHDRVDKVVYGDISVNSGHPAFGQIMEDAEKRPHLLKLSHEIPKHRYKAHRSDDELIIDRVYDVDCVAIVTNGGVNSSLYEQAEDVEMDLKTAADLKRELPALFEEVTQAALKDAKNDEKLVEAIQARDAAEAKISELEGELKKLQESVARHERTEEIRAKAAELKVQCSDDLLEALVLLESDEKVEAVLKGQPKLTEEVVLDTEDDEKPKQSSSLKKTLPLVNGYRRPSDWITKYASN